MWFALFVCLVLFRSLGQKVGPENIEGVRAEVEDSRILSISKCISLVCQSTAHILMRDHDAFGSSRRARRKLNQQRVVRADLRQWLSVNMR
ncbi:hypothetical protein CLAFUW4_20034 [Fulvia fulva]|nr:hypothetical protein CLAFUR4_20034 [Fulvia fulva]KAK4628527.1 hypothetical protein CLAFUR0_20034 [Fulvia fulva]WPV13997.1 hypothetical protein CLAFUW4_20034 [Fulvia fulva]